MYNVRRLGLFIEFFLQFFEFEYFFFGGGGVGGGFRKLNMFFLCVKILLLIFGGNHKTGLFLQIETSMKHRVKYQLNLGYPRAQSWGPSSSFVTYMTCHYL